MMTPRAMRPWTRSEQRRAFKRIAQLLTQAPKLAVIPKAGHGPIFLEAADLFVRASRKFLKTG